jgi:uncharacterized membrane protein YjgN (DUF898 family)
MESVRGRSGARWIVHLALIVTASTSLVLEPMLTLHIALGLVFVWLVVVHLRQRRHTTAALARRYAHPSRLGQPAGRLALSNGVLLILTLVMLASGLWDWLSGDPTRIRWHAISGVVLAAYLAVHSYRRRRRLRTSRVS